MQHRPPIGFHFHVRDANVTAGPYILVTNSLTPLISARGFFLIARPKLVSSGMPSAQRRTSSSFPSSCLLRFRGDCVVAGFGSEYVLDRTL